MSFWTDGGNAQDPKRNFRFKVTIGGFGEATAEQASDEIDKLVWFAKKVQKPNFTTAESKHIFMGHTYYWPGKTEWQEISLTLVDPVSPNATGILYNIVQNSGFIIPSKNRLITQGKRKSAQQLGSFTIEQINSDGGMIEKWELKNPFIKKISFSDLDYENDELTTIDIGIRYDWATCETGKVKSDTPFFNSNTGQGEFGN